MGKLLAAREKRQRREDGPTGVRPTCRPSGLLAPTCVLERFSILRQELLAEHTDL